MTDLFLYLPIFLHFNTKVFFVFKKVQEKKKEQEAAKPDPDADYVDDDEDYGYDPEFENDDVRSVIQFNDSIEIFCSRNCFHIVTRFQKLKFFHLSKPLHCTYYTVC